MASKLLFGCSALVCIGLRIFLKLAVIDPESGFYEGNALMAGLFTAVLGVSVVALLVLGLVKKPRTGLTADGGLETRVLAELVGLSALFLCGAQMFETARGLDGQSMSGAFVALLFQLIGVASGFVFLWIANGRGKIINGVLLLLPLFWQVYVLMTSFMAYTAIRSVSDQMLTIVMMILLAPFLLAHGRVLGGVNSEKGVRQMVMFGLPFSLVALTVSIGMIASAFAGRSLEIGLILPAAIFYLLLGLYAAVTVLRLRPAR